MGTRAQFFIGDPMQPDARWLGCVAYDGYPDGDCGAALASCEGGDQFAVAVDKLASERDDFCNPTKCSFPFPWRDDLFLTDYTYAFFGGKVMVTCFHGGWRPLASHLGDGVVYQDDDGNDLPDELPGDVKFRWDNQDNPAGPDSIMILTLRRE